MDQKGSYRLILLGVGLAAVYWFLESAVHVFAFGETDFFKQVIAPSANELWMRLVAMAILVFFGFYAEKTVSLRRSVEVALRQNEQWLSAMLRGIGDGVISTDHRGNVAFLNPVAEKLTGWTGEAARGRSIEEVFNITIPDEDQEKLRTVQDAIDYLDERLADS